MSNIKKIDDLCMNLDNVILIDIKKVSNWERKKINNELKEGSAFCLIFHTNSYEEEQKIKKSKIKYKTEEEAETRRTQILTMQNSKEIEI